MSDRPEKINLSDVHSRQVDTELLNELRDLFVKAEEQKERYDFTWNGKAKAYFEAAAPTTKTLRAQPEESVNFENSENLFITGDNLEALKLLQESYLGKIDMIYIDPPYNTGKDFVYQDNFKKTQKENDVSEGIIDEAGNRLVKNEKSNGRYHSDWLTMMYPRLKLARNLLSDSGIIFRPGILCRERRKLNDGYAGHGNSLDRTPHDRQYISDESGICCGKCGERRYHMDPGILKSISERPGRLGDRSGQRRIRRLVWTRALRDGNCLHADSKDHGAGR